MSIYSPTWLYIKQHTVTGMLYFGKTSRTWSEKYKGSGKYWTSHINKHGRENVVTLWKLLFEEKEDLQEFALFFSDYMQIAESKEWANLKPETGIDGGGLPGRVMSSEERLAISARRKLQIPPMLGKHMSEESNEKRRKTINGRPPPRHAIDNSANARRGGHITEEHKARIKEKCPAGWKHTEEDREKMRGPKSEETKQKMRKPKTLEARANMKLAQQALGKKIRERNLKLRDS